jgi:hypothetical protein
MYLTRDEAVAELVKDGATEPEASALLDGALRLYPQSQRTNFLMITGYLKGSLGYPDDMFTIGRW